MLLFTGGCVPVGRVRGAATQGPDAAVRQGDEEPGETEELQRGVVQARHALPPQEVSRGHSMVLPQRKMGHGYATMAPSEQMGHGHSTKTGGKSCSH